jgi:hypothetical protein
VEHSSSQLVTNVEPEAIEEIQSKPITNEIEGDELTNETQEKRFNLSEEIQDMDSDITEIDRIVDETIEKAEEVVGVHESTTKEPIRPENEPNIEIAKIKNNSQSHIALDSAKSSFISLEASSSPTLFCSSVLLLAMPAV